MYITEKQCIDIITTAVVIRKPSRKRRSDIDIQKVGDSTIKAILEGFKYFTVQFWSIRVCNNEKDDENQNGNVENRHGRGPRFKRFCCSERTRSRGGNFPDGLMCVWCSNNSQTTIPDNDHTSKNTMERRCTKKWEEKKKKKWLAH